VLVTAGVYLRLLAGTGGGRLAAAFRRRFRPVTEIVGPGVGEGRADETAPERVVGRRPRLLIVCPYPIYPANHGGGVRLYNLVRLLSRDLDLYLLIFIRRRDDPEQRRALEPFCREVHFHRWQPRFDHRPWQLEPPNARLFGSQRAAVRIRELVETRGIDVVQLEYTELAQYRHAVAGTPSSRTPVILVEHDVAFRSFRRRRSLGFLERFPDSRHFGAGFGDYMRLLRHEVAACREVEQVHVMSADDGRYLASFLPDGARRMRVVPNAVDVEHYRPPEGLERSGVLFVGNFQNLPNVDALEYFLAEIWPRLRERRPGVRLSLVGAKMSEEILALDGEDGVEVVGAVPDMRPYYHRHRVLAVPLRAGSGTRLKLFEAFAAGIPAVSTTLGAEGIACRDRGHLLIADEPESFAAALLELLEDDDLHRQVAAAALELVAARYDWSAAARVNLDGVRELVAARGGEAPDATVADAEEAEEPGGEREADGGVEISIVLPTLAGGELLGLALEAIDRQEIDRRFEVIAVDSGSPAADLERMERHGVRLHRIDQRDFNHGLTRDLGASLARGEVLVFINQDAVPTDEHWLHRITEPLFADDPPAAVQGGMLELPHGNSVVRRFFWDSCGERFYFTSESDRWIRNHHGIGFSTVNAAIRRDVWRRIPFGWAPIMEDKKWQREVMEAGYEIVQVPAAAVHHTHDYDLRSLKRRCRSEGYGWRLLGERYYLSDMVRDMAQLHLYRELFRGVVRWRVRRPAELLFPWLRPWMLWVGNRWSRGVEL
jgi:rhamnosyltransferase